MKRYIGQDLEGFQVQKSPWSLGYTTLPACGGVYHPGSSLNPSVPGTGDKNQFLKQKRLLSPLSLRKLQGFRSSVPRTWRQKSNIYFLLCHNITAGQKGECICSKSLVKSIFKTAVPEVPFRIEVRSVRRKMPSHQ